MICRVFELLLTLFLFLTIATLIVLFVALLLLEKEKAVNPISNWPMVTVLVAARNEEKNIEACLQRLAGVDYPKDKLEVLIGNDASTDRTAGIASGFCKNHPQFRLIEITENVGLARAKANVLAQLARQATAEMLVVTDADIEVKPGWIKSLIAEFDDEKTGIVSGTTIVKGNRLFEKMQGLDWAYFFGLLIGFDKLGLKSTAVGNNMAFRKVAYQSTGGYEHFPFSVTEDFKLFLEIRKQGWNSKNLLHSQSLNYSKGQTRFLNLLHQRKRWLIGSRDLPPVWQVLFVMFGLFYPMLLALFFINPINAITLWVAKIVLQSAILLRVMLRLRERFNLLLLLLLEPYSILSSISSSVFYLLPVNMQWKERSFS